MSELLFRPTKKRRLFSNKTSYVPLVVKKEIIVKKEISDDISNRELLKTVLNELTSLKEQLITVDQLREQIAVQEQEIHDLQVIINDEITNRKYNINKDDIPDYFG